MVLSIGGVSGAVRRWMLPQKLGHRLAKGESVEFVDSEESFSSARIENGDVRILTNRVKLFVFHAFRAVVIHLPKDEVALDEVANCAVTPYIAVETLASELLVILNVDQKPKISGFAFLSRADERPGIKQIDRRPEQLFQRLELFGRFVAERARRGERR